MGDTSQTSNEGIRAVTAVQMRHFPKQGIIVQNAKNLPQTWGSQRRAAKDTRLQVSDASDVR